MEQNHFIVSLLCFCSLPSAIVLCFFIIFDSKFTIYMCQYNFFSSCFSLFKSNNKLNADFCVWKYSSTLFQQHSDNGCHVFFSCVCACHSNQYLSKLNRMKKIARVFCIFNYVIISIEIRTLFRANTKAAAAVFFFTSIYSNAVVDIWWRIQIKIR